MTYCIEQLPWCAFWREGGRLADVYHVEYEYAIDTFEVPGWDPSIGESSGTVVDVWDGLEEWVADHAAEWLREPRQPIGHMKFLGLIKPKKPISEMTDQELKEFARELADRVDRERGSSEEYES